MQANKLNQRKISLWFLGAFFIANLTFGQDDRASVAVRTPALGDAFNNKAPAGLNMGLLHTEIEAAITESRKLRVLTRKKGALKAIRSEQEFASSELAAGDAAASGELANADFLILPVVENFQLLREHKRMPNFDEKYFMVDRGMLQVSAQMMDNVSGEIVKTFSVKSDFSTERKVVNGKRGRPDVGHYASMAKQVSARLTNSLVDAVFPMKVVSRDRRGQVIINRGDDGGLNLGEILEVYYVGEEMIDPDTGKSLGALEEYVGEVEVVRINPKFTITKVRAEADEELAPISSGDILRRKQ